MEEYTEEDLEKLLEKEKPPFTMYLKAFFLLFIVGGGMLFVNFMAKNAPETPVEKKPSQTLETILGVTDQIVDSGGVKKALESISNDVKDEASRAADRAIENTTDSAVGYVYENSVVKVIEKMIETLPQAQRQKLIKTLKERYPVE
ncbi:hypothetical protein KBD81_03270 [Candidatus Woesebacteria bacterium]|nr:hypothetical protein [Candidatus Woesebacteria bacterium]